MYRPEVQMHEHVRRQGRHALATSDEVLGRATCCDHGPGRSFSIRHVNEGMSLRDVVEATRRLARRCTNFICRATVSRKACSSLTLELDSITGVTWIRKINERYGTSIEAAKI